MSNDGYIDLAKKGAHVAPRRGHVTLRFLPRKRDGLVAVPDSVDHESMSCPQWEVVAVGRGRVDNQGVEVPIEFVPGQIVCTATRLVGIASYEQPGVLDGQKDRYVVMDEQFVLGVASA